MFLNLAYYEKMFVCLHLPIQFGRVIYRTINSFLAVSSENGLDDIAKDENGSEEWAHLLPKNSVSRYRSFCEEASTCKTEQIK